MDLINQIAAGELSHQLIERVLLRKSLLKFGEKAFPLVNGAPFKSSRHFVVVSNHLEAVAKKDHPVGRIKRLRINMPPSTGKSFFTSVVYVPWIWTWWPECRVLYFSYDLTRGTKDSSSARTLIKDDWYQSRFGDKYEILAGEDRKLFYKNSAGGWRMTSYPGGPALGEHPDIIVIDDPISPVDVLSWQAREDQKRWYFEDLSTRGIARDVAHVVSHQRLHVEDLSGHIDKHHKQLESTGQASPWHNIVLPMYYDPELAMPDRGYGGEWRTSPGELIAPEILTEEVVKDLQRTLAVQGPWAEAAQLGQKPIRRDGSIFKMSKVNEIPFAEFPKVFDEVVRFWDLAGSEDTGCYTAGPLVGRVGADPIMSKFYLLDMEHQRLNGDDVEDLIGQTLKRDWAVYHGDNALGRQVLHSFFEREGGSSGKRVAELLERKFAAYNLTQIAPTADKTTRAGPLASIIKDGRFYVPSDAPFTAPFIAEFEGFPGGKFKDQVDGTSGAIMEMVNPSTKLRKLVISSGDRTPKVSSKQPKCSGNCRRPAFAGEKCCESCDTGVHTAECNAKYNDWYIKNSR